MKMLNYVLQGRWLAAMIPFTIGIQVSLGSNLTLVQCVLTQLQEWNSGRAGGVNFGDVWGYPDDAQFPTHCANLTFCTGRQSTVVEKTNNEALTSFYHLFSETTWTLKAEQN